MPLNEPAVAARDLVLAYDSVVAVERSSFTIPKGSITAVIGPNGSGKSTLLSAIAGLVRPLNGALDVAAGEGRIAYVLQTTKVNEALPISVQEVVTMGRYAHAGWYRRLGADDRAVVGRAMDRMSITRLAARQLHRLSGGQRQRAYVAQGLAQDHDILLLDEPMSGIDITAARAIDEVIHEEAASGNAVIMTTHDLSEARVADHVLLLAGRVVASGPPTDVLTAENLTVAYGPALLHVQQGRVFIDDDAHRPVEGRHSHRPPSAEG